MENGPVMNLKPPSFDNAMRAAVALIPHVEDIWSVAATMGKTRFTLIAHQHDDVAPLLTRAVKERGVLPIVREEHWICHPDAVEVCLRSMLPPGFEVKRAPYSDFPFEYEFTYTGRLP